jgi:cytochrome c oxidase assembly factor CtaG/putative copper export protein
MCSANAHAAPAARPEGTWRSPLVLGGAAVAGVVTAALVTGATAPLLVSDPGPLVRWGLPFATVTAHVAGALTIGLLGLAAFLMPETTRTNRRVEATRLAAVTAFVWAVAAGVACLFTFADLAGLPLSDPALLPQLGRYVFSLDATRILALSSGLAMLVAGWAALARSRATMAWLTLFALVAVVIGALTSHSGGSASHEDVVNSMGLHLLGVSVWVGGLAGLLLMRPRLGRDLAVTVARYSTLALWAYAAVALSGLQQAILRIGSWAAATTPYGLVVIAKAVALLILGALGWQQRRAVVARLARDPGDGRALARLGLVELALMGAATGLAAVLARSAPPVPDSLPNPSIVLTLTGYPDPGPQVPGWWYAEWRVNWLFLAIALLAVGLYVAGVLRLRARGDHWPWWRTTLWVVGWLVWVYFTSGPPEIWGRVLFSVHMVMHMGVAMILPLLLVPASPITLALRALPARKDRTWGPRELLLQVVHSRAMRFFANPVVAALLFFVSLAIFYWSPTFDLALTTHTGHLLMMGHFVLTGYLFVWVLIGTDPGPPKWSPLMLLVILFATIAFHAFFGVALTDSQSLLAEDFFTRINLPWGPDPLADQHTAGMIAWGVGEAPTLVLAVIIAAQWVTKDRLETARKDRQADRDGDADLAAYNDYLASLRGTGDQ